jgi:tRNA(fMet)-specific endonuclease VapC
MAGFLLDTNIITAGIAPKPNPRLLSKLDERSSECFTAAPVIHEIRYGIELLEPSRRREAVERYLNEVILRVYPVLPYDGRAAEWHGKERARLRKLGNEPPYFDGLIASIAKVSDLILVTANVRDFSRYKGLRVEDWRR